MIVWTALMSETDTAAPRDLKVLHISNVGEPETTAMCRVTRRLAFGSVYSASSSRCRPSVVVDASVYANPAERLPNAYAVPLTVTQVSGTVPLIQLRPVGLTMETICQSLDGSSAAVSVAPPALTVHVPACWSCAIDASPCDWTMVAENANRALASSAERKSIKTRRNM